MHWLRESTLAAALVAVGAGTAAAQMGVGPFTPMPNVTVEQAPVAPWRVNPPPGEAAPPSTGEEGGARGKPAAPQGIYFGGPSSTSSEAEPEISQGPPPDVHVVRTGDTLWDICGYYFNNPWEWPRVWALNGAITNPHWIYPGDVVRLAAAGQEPASQPASAPAQGEPIEPAPAEVAPAAFVELRQGAFVNLEDLKWAGTVAGSTEERAMLSTGDEIYVEYPEGKPPQVGLRYAVYSPTKDIKSRAGKQLGTYVLLRGEVEIVEVKKGKTARATITYANDTIERGQRVGTVKTQFKQVPPVAADRDLEAHIAGVIGNLNLVATGQVVFLDAGKGEGVRVGNRFQVVRRGDARPGRGPRSEVDANDQRYPEESIAQVTVVEVGDGVSVGLVSASDKEVEVGDRAVMRTGR